MEISGAASTARSFNWCTSWHIKAWWCHRSEAPRHAATRLVAAARVGCVFAAGLCSCWSCRWQNDNDTLAASCKMASLIVLKNWWLIWNILNLCLEIKRPRHLQNLQDMKDGKVPWWAMPPDVLQLYLAPLMRSALPFHGASAGSPIPCRKSKRPIASSCGNGIQIRIQTKLPGCVWQNAGALLKSFWSSCQPLVTKVKMATEVFQFLQKASGLFKC